MKVLYFDDEPFISEALAENLRLSFRREVELISGINDLFDNINSNNFDIIILDIMTPIPESIFFSKKEIAEMEDGMNTGIVIAKKIWKLNASVPILFLSARSRPDAISKFKEEGKYCEYLHKPELAETVDITLNQLLNSKSTNL